MSQRRVDLPETTVSVADDADGGPEEENWQRCQQSTHRRRPTKESILSSPLLAVAQVLSRTRNPHADERPFLVYIEVEMEMVLEGNGGENEEATDQ
jgi:hypothetical protein